MRGKASTHEHPSVFRRLRTDRGGSVATIFAVSLVPVLIAAGIGLDLTRALASRSNLQDALDATALALAHLPPSTPQATLDARARTWLNANLTDGAAMSSPSLTVTLSKGQVVLDASAKVTTTLAAIAGYKEIPIAAHSTVKWGLGRVEVVMVLDNTGSMAGTKLSRLKSAARTLVETLEDQVAADDPNTLKVGLVPFSTTVRLSASSSELNSYRTAPWMTGVMPTQYGDDLFTNDAGAKLTNVNRFSTFSAIGQSWAGCVETRPAPYDVQDTAPSSGTPATLFVPYFAPDEPDSRAMKKSGSGNSYYSSENDYLDDERSDAQAQAKVGSNQLARWRYMQGYSGKYDEAVSSSHINAGRGPNAGCTMQPLLRLTTNMTTVKNRISAMTAVGNTNIPVGLVWGWRLLSPNLPFSDGAPYSAAETKKFLVLLTDGDNVYGDSDNPSNSLYTALGYAWQSRLAGITVNASQSSRESAMDARMGVLCGNIKNAGITVYVVRIDVSGKAPASLSGCASSEDKFYDIDSSGLADAFANIAGSIGKLRIAQ